MAVVCKQTKRALAGKLGLHAIAHLSDVAIIGKTLEGGIVSWNKGAEKLYGYKAEEIVGNSISVLMPSHNPDELQQILKRLGRSQDLVNYETTRVQKNGDAIEIRLSISPVRGKEGTIIGASVVAHDVGKQKQAETTLRLREERFRVAFQHAPVTVFNQDVQLRYT
jgi:PAS domain S-box-containing protein